jgi:ATP-binding cassette subfamily F protein 3
VAPRTAQTELRNLLGCFLFSEDDVFKRIGVLSGGERNRYALARMLLRPSNFLLLDEPTNHLDLRAKDVLLEALETFTGTVVFVSHDRYFIEHLANRVFEIADGEVRVYSGNFADYLWRKEGGAEEVPTLKDVLIGVPPAQPVEMPSRNTPAKRINPIKLKQMQDQAKQLEARIAELESQIQQSELSLSDFVGREEATRLSRLLETQRAELAEALAQWEGVTEEIEATA